jgi:DNA-binding GntR family transcriptional regulator
MNRFPRRKAHYSMSDLASSDSLAPARRVRLGEDVADRVRDAILRGVFSPGHHLREDELAARMQVSRGPVREALAVLEREGLVNVAPHRGATVVQLTPQDLTEVYSLRIGLEVVAVQLAARHGTPEEFARAEAVLKEFSRPRKGKMTEQDAARLDLEFHDVFYEASRNERLRTTWLGLRSQVYLFLLQRNIASSDWRMRSIAGHTDILEAVRSRDERRAVKLITEHVSYAYTMIAGTFDTPARPGRLDLTAPQLKIKTR